jgi:hypothetical protein
MQKENIIKLSPHPQHPDVKLCNKEPGVVRVRHPKCPEQESD